MSADTIKELQVALSMDTNGFSSAIKKAESDIKSMQSSFKQNSQTIKGYKDSFDGLTEKIKINDTIIAKHQTTIERNTQELKEHESQTQKLKTAYDTAKSTYQENARALEKVKTELGENSVEYKTLKATVDANKVAMDKAGQAYTNNATKVQNLNTKISNSQTQIAKLSAENVKLTSKLSQLGSSTQTTAQKMQALKEKTALLDSKAKLLTSSLGLNATASQKLRVEHTNLANKIDVTKQKVDILKSKMTELRATKAQLVNQTTNLKRQILEEETALEKAKAQYGENSAEVQKIITKISQYKSELIATESVIEKTNQDINKNTIALNTNQAELNESGHAMTALKSKMNALPFTNLSTKLKSLSTSLQTFSSGLVSAGMGLSLYVTAPILGVGSAALTTASNFIDATNTIRVGTGATGEALDKLVTSAKNVYTTVPNAIDEVSSTLADLNTRTGLTGEKLEGLTTTLINLSKITKEDLGSSIASSTRFFGDWGIAVEDYEKSLDKLFLVSQNTGITTSELMNKLVQFGVPLRQLGFSMEESATMLGKFEKEGVNTSVVLSSLRIALNGMAKDGVKDVNKALWETIDAIKNAGSEGEATAKAIELFGSKAGSDMAGAIREGRFEIQELVDTINNGGDTINSLAQETYTFTDKMTVIKNKLAVALEPLGTSLIDLIDKSMPQIEKIINAVADMVTKFSEMDEAGQKATLLKIAIIASAGPILTILGKLGLAISGLMSGASSLVGGIGKLASKFGLFSSSATTATTAVAGTTTASTGLIAKLGTMGSKALGLIGPWGLLATAVLGVGVAVTNTAQKNLENMKSMQESAKETVHNISSRYETLSNNVSSALDSIKNSQEEWMTPQAKASLTQDFKDIQKIINGEGGNANKEMQELISHLSENADNMKPELKKATAESLQEMAETFARDGQLSVRQAELLIDDINNTFNTKLKLDNTILDDLLFNGSLDRMGSNLRDAVGSKIQGWMGDVSKASASIVTSIKTEFSGLDSIDTVALFTQINNDLKDLGASASQTKDILMGTLKPAILESMSGEEASLYAQQVVASCFSASEAIEGYSQVITQMTAGYEYMTLEQQLAFGEMSAGLYEQMGYMEEILSGSYQNMLNENELLWADMVGSQLQGSENMQASLTELSNGIGAQIANLVTPEEIAQATSWTNSFISRLVETGQITATQAQAMSNTINEHLANKEVTTKVNIDTTGFESEINNSIADINALTGLTATPSTLLDDNAFNETEQTLKGKIDSLKKEKAEPKVIARAEQALKDLQSVKNSLDKLKDKTITIKTKKIEETVKSTFTPSSLSSTSGTTRAFAPDNTLQLQSYSRAMPISNIDFSDYQISGGYYTRQSSPKVESKEENILETIKSLLVSQSNSKNNSGFVQNLTINSAKELSPREIAKQTRLAGQKLARLY